jgi:acetyltransferase
MAPYPAELECHLTLPDGRAIFVRPIRPDDEPLYGPFIAAETPEDLRLRFFAPIKEIAHQLLDRLTHLDYATAIAFIALDEATGEMLGVARLHEMSIKGSGEYAIIVRSDLKGHGLGWQLMQMIIAWGRKRHLQSIQGQVLHDNAGMLEMCRTLGFEIKSSADEPGICDVTLVL